MSPQAPLYTARMRVYFRNLLSSYILSRIKQSILRANYSLLLIQTVKWIVSVLTARGQLQARIFNMALRRKGTSYIECDSFGTRPKKMRISQRLFITFWTRICDYIPCFMRSMSILVCRSLTSGRHRDNNDWCLAPRRAQPCHCVVR